MIPCGWNRRPVITNRILGVQSTMKKKEIVPGGWISQREPTNTQHHPGLVEDNMEEKEMIPGGWNRQREASNKKKDSGSAEGPTT